MAASGPVCTNNETPTAEPTPNATKLRSPNVRCSFCPCASGSAPARSEATDFVLKIDIVPNLQNRDACSRLPHRSLGRPASGGQGLCPWTPLGPEAPDPRYLRFRI